jgi:hypothetical protein
VLSFPQVMAGAWELEALDSVPWQPSEVLLGHHLIAMPDAMYAILPGMTLLNSCTSSAYDCVAVGCMHEHVSVCR